MPKACLLCLRSTHEAHHLCVACAKELPILTHSCVKCAQFLNKIDMNITLCGQCLVKTPAFHRVYVTYAYRFPIPRLIAGLKFDGKLSHARMLSQLMLHDITNKWYRTTPLPELILPMPLHRQRLKERGFNQAVEIARPISRALKIPLDTQGIARKKATQPQSSLPAKERRQNVAHAFRAKHRYDGLHLAVVDDVMTTGQTVSALATLLKKQGAKRIDVWCAARCYIDQ